jgi:hypothetical protein
VRKRLSDNIEIVVYLLVMTMFFGAMSFGIYEAAEHPPVTTITITQTP